MRPFLIAFVAPVGSGKTYIDRRLAEELRAAHVNTDAIRVRLRKQRRSMSRATSIADRLQSEALRRGISVSARPRQNKNAGAAHP